MNRQAAGDDGADIATDEQTDTKRDDHEPFNFGGEGVEDGGDGIGGESGQILHRIGDDEWLINGQG